MEKSAGRVFYRPECRLLAPIRRTLSAQEPPICMSVAGRRVSIDDTPFRRDAWRFKCAALTQIQSSQMTLISNIALFMESKPFPFLPLLPPPTQPHRLRFCLHHTVESCCCLEAFPRPNLRPSPAKGRAVLFINISPIVLTSYPSKAFRALSRLRRLQPTDTARYTALQPGLSATTLLKITLAPTKNNPDLFPLPLLSSPFFVLVCPLLSAASNRSVALVVVPLVAPLLLAGLSP